MITLLKIFSFFLSYYARNKLIALRLSLSQEQFLLFPFSCFPLLAANWPINMTKRLLFVGSAFIEFGGASLAAIGLFYENTSILFIALFYFGVTAALFGPAKYGVLPDHLTQEELP